ncbi:MAG: ABC transporter permease [Nitrospiraceae bacterium]|nr:ABC transporter permease [Nitrospiraceae bacterium]
MELRTINRTVIRPSGGWPSLAFDEIWAYRELLGMLAWRDVSVRYKQSVAGIGWAVFQPLMTMVIFTIIFGKFAKLPSDGLPYPVFAYCALLPWNYFSQSLTGSSDSIVGSSYLITKVYFPRLILPLGKVTSGLIDFGVAFVILLGMMAWYGIAPTAGILLLPVFMLVAMLTALGVGLWFTALNVKYRDVRFIVPYIAQFWLFASPVAYSTSLVPEKWRWLYGLNPMVGVIEGFRWALLGKAVPDFGMMLASFGAVCLVLVTGLYYFRKMEETFADNV